MFHDQWGRPMGNLRKAYYVVGKNEDGTFFAHRVRPNAGETGDLNRVRTWLWALKKNETIEARQGDLALIPKKRPTGEEIDSPHQFEGHSIKGDKIWQSKTERLYVLNPDLSHGQHRHVKLKGLYEIRQSKVWIARHPD